MPRGHRRRTIKTLDAPVLDWLENCASFQAGRNAYTRN
jgi:hypothetical protein